MAQGNGEIKPRPVLCAGQGCNERRNCLRYRMRYASATWASYDLEHQARDEEFCPAKEYVSPVRFRKT